MIRIPPLPSLDSAEELLGPGLIAQGSFDVVLADLEMGAIARSCSGVVSAECQQRTCRAESCCADLSAACNWLGDGVDRCRVLDGSIGSKPKQNRG